jgi:hypothetical protein
MTSNVFANGMGVSGKASSHKVIASMPDVCLSPPSPPAGELILSLQLKGYAVDHIPADGAVALVVAPRTKHP